MKTKNKILKSVLIPTSFAVASFVMVPFATADDKTKIKVKDDKIVVKTDDGKAKIEADGDIDVKGKEGAKALQIARKTLAAQEAKAFKESLVKGYVVPKERTVYLDPVPKTYVERLPAPPENVTYRVYDGTVYAINPKTYQVVDIIETDAEGNSIHVTVPATQTVTTTTTTASGTTITKGYVIPRDRYASFTEVPVTLSTRLEPAPRGTVYRYYDGGVYLVDPQTYTVVDVVTIDRS